MNTYSPTAPGNARSHWAVERSPVRWAALVCGLGFIVFGFAGFVPGVTTNFDSIEMAGEQLASSEARLLGIFQVSVLHNVLHVFYGVAGLAMSRFSGSARLHLRFGGIVAAVLWIYGLAVGPDTTENFLPLNTADDWLNFGLALALIGLSFLPRSAKTTAAEATR